jgi:hypothetical protein
LRAAARGSFVPPLLDLHRLCVCEACSRHTRRATNMADTKVPPPDLVKDGLEVTASNSSSKDHDPVPREGETEHLPSFEHERALALKFDVRILPCLALMYVISAARNGASRVACWKTARLASEIPGANDYGCVLLTLQVPVQCA